MNTDLVSEQDGPPAEAGPDLWALAGELVAAARGQGVELTGPGGR